MLRQASPQTEAERSANFRKLFLWVSAVCVACLLISCHTTKQAETIMVGERSRTTNHDTIYLHDLCYDSIYVSQDKFIDRTRDTITITNTKTEYRYKLKRDTILRTQFIEHHDSIPYEVIVTQTKEVRAPPKWYDKTAYTIAIIALLYLLFRIRSPISSFIRKFI